MQYLVRDQYTVCPIFNITMTLKVTSTAFVDVSKLGEIMNSEEDRDLNTGLLRSQKYKHEKEQDSSRTN